MTYYIYAGTKYNTEAEANAAVVAMKNVLDNTPSVYAQIKLLSGNATDGWTVPAQALTDAEIAAISGDGFYSAYSEFSGETHLGLTAAEAIAKVQEYKIKYGQYHNANTLHIVTIPTNVDMSGYV